MPQRKRDPEKIRKVEEEKQRQKPIDYKKIDRIEKETDKKR